MNNQPKANMHSEQGMTLIEILIAIAILAMVTTMIYGGFTQTSRQKNRIEGQLDRTHAIRSTLDRIATEIHMAFISAQQNPNVAAQSMFTAFVGKERSAGDRIDFTSFAQKRLIRDQHESDQCEISYFLARDPESSEKYVLARRQAHRLDDKPQEGGKVQILLEDVVEFKLRYLDPLTGEWLSTWDTTSGSMQPNRLPSQVQITLTVADLRNPNVTQTFVTRATPKIRFGLNHAVYNP